MKKANPNLCEIKGCYDKMYVIYYHHNVCEKHWNSTLNLKRVFGIPEQESMLKTNENPIKTDLKVYL